MGKGLYPDTWADNAYDIDYKALYAHGFRSIIFDIDNTLVQANKPATEKAKELFARLRSIGFKTCILSNNTGARAGTFARAVGSDVVTGALKPFPGKYREAMQVLGTDRSSTLFIGDQIYTDIWGANNAGIYSILTMPLNPSEEWWIKIKRLLERPVRRKVIQSPQRWTKGKNNIALIGFMGSGKTTVSHALHALCGLQELDTDQMIVQREKMTIAEIFAQMGEPYFRAAEQAVIESLENTHGAVISCGGGAACRKENVESLKRSSTIVLLTATPETTLERVGSSTERPILNGHMNTDYIRELQEKRRAFYEAAADITVATDGKTPEEIAKEIVSYIKEFRRR